jgi:hypothetical protein
VYSFVGTSGAPAFLSALGSGWCPGTAPRQLRREAWPTDREAGGAEAGGAEAGGAEAGGAEAGGAEAGGAEAGGAEAVAAARLPRLFGDSPASAWRAASRWTPAYLAAQSGRAPRLGSVWR